MTTSACHIQHTGPYVTRPQKVTACSPIGLGFDYSKTGVNRVLTLIGNPVAAPTSLPLLQTSLL